MDELKHEVELVHLIYKKLYNQHRTQVWWKYFSILHRRLRQMVEAGKLDQTICEYLLAKLIPTAYRAFQNILAQGAFITVGFTLMASLAKIRSILSQEFPDQKTKPARAQTKTLPTAVDDDADSDIGDIVDLDSITASEPVNEKLVTKPVKPKPLKHKLAAPKRVSDDKQKKKLKKKKNRDAIDDIFG